MDSHDSNILLEPCYDPSKIPDFGWGGPISLIGFGLLMSLMQLLKNPDVFGVEPRVYRCKENMMGNMSLG